ncbi:MAG: ATPase, T2SS/T4P/T4SS family, partial [Akkermansiaceae bacterium]
MEPLQRGDLETLWQACGASVENDRDRDVRLPMGSGGYLRVNLYRTMDKLAAAVRPIKEEIPELESLGLPTEMIRQWMTRSSGIIIVTGATGSGKSTTIASALEDLNRSRRSHVVTLE